MLGSFCETTAASNTPATTTSSLVLQSKVIERLDDPLNESNEQDFNFASFSFPIPPKTGFPTPPLRQSKNLNCPDSSYRNNPPSLSTTCSSSSSSSSSSFSVEKERASIHKENEAKLASMTEDEIMEAQLFIKEHFSTASLDFLKNKRNHATSTNKKAATSIKTSALNSFSSLRETLSNATNPASSPSSSSSALSSASSMVDAFSPSQLALQLPYPISSYYFSFRGDCVTQAADPCSRTFPAILTLTHSRSIPQRVMAATWLGHLLKRLQEQTYSPLVKQHLVQAFYDLHAFLHLRHLLDDPCSNVVLATLQAWTCWMPSSFFQLETVLPLVHVLCVPFWSKLNIKTNESTQCTLSDHAQFIRLNWVLGLLPTHLFTRLTYLFTTMFRTQSMLPSIETHPGALLDLDSHHLGRYCILKWMYFMCFFSKQACQACIDISLKEVMPYFHRSWTSFTSSQSHASFSSSSSSLASSTPSLENEEQELILWLLLLRCLVQSDPKVATTWLVPWLTTLDAPLTSLSSKASSTFFKALAFLFMTIISYGFHPPTTWMSFLFQLDTPLLPLPFTFQFISCMQQHQVSLSSFDFTSVFSSAHTLLLHPPSSPSMTPHAVPFEMWVTLSEAWSLSNVVSTLEHTCFSSWLTFLCECLKSYFLSLPISATTTTSSTTTTTTHSLFSLDQSNKFTVSENARENITSPSSSSNVQASSVDDVPHSSKTFVWNLATPISFNDIPSILSKLLLCFHFLFLHLPSTNMNTDLFQQWMDWVRWLFKTAPSLNWIIPLARVFSTFLLHPSTPKFIKSFPHLHSEYALMAYYALIYLPIPFELTWDRLYQQVSCLLDASLWSTFFVPSMDATFLKENQVQPLSCLYIETPSVYVLGPQAYRRFPLSDQLSWFDQVYTWHQSLASNQPCLGLTLSELIPFYLDTSIVAHFESSSTLIKLTHVTLTFSSFEDSAVHRMEWDTLVHHFMSQSFLDSVVQQGLIYLLFHCQISLSFKVYALNMVLTTVSPLLIQRLLVYVDQVPLAYFQPISVDPKWIELCAHLLSLLTTSRSSLLLWCTLAQLTSSHPKVQKLPLPLQLKLKEFILRLEQYRETNLLNKIELPSF